MIRSGYGMSRLEPASRAGTDISAGGRAVAFSPHGDLVAHTHNYIDLVLRDVGTGTVTHTLRGHSGMIYGLDWSLSEPILASSAWDGTIRLWNVESGACVEILQPPGPYAGMNIAGATGISDAQRAALQTLGAVEDPSSERSLVRHHLPGTMIEPA